MTTTKTRKKKEEREREEGEGDVDRIGDKKKKGYESVRKIMIHIDFCIL